jgi:uncharacterized membrane-anchored protein YhcB (DUF1043 family)
MADELTNELAQRLRKAEEAASYMERLESLASQAPALREQVSLMQRMEERERHRQDSLERAQIALAAADQAQQNLPSLITDAANLVDQLARMLREVDTFRREATASLSVVDRMDYEDEIDQALDQEEESPVQRDAQSIRMIVASRHGSSRVRQMMEEFTPGFEVFTGCNLDETPMRRELTNLIMAQLAAEAEANRAQQQRRMPPPPPPPAPSEPEPATTATEASGEEE